MGRSEDVQKPAAFVSAAPLRNQSLPGPVPLHFPDRGRVLSKLLSFHTVVAFNFVRIPGGLRGNLTGNQI